MPSDQVWDRFAISAELRRRGFTLVGLASAYGLERTACSVALLRRHRAGEAAIAAAIDVPAATLWPERYRDRPRADRPKHRRRRRRRTSRNRSSN